MTKPSSASFRPIMLSAWHEMGGNTLLRLLDSHPQLFVYPFESQISTANSTSIVSEEFVPNRYRYPEFTTEMSPSQAYQAIWDQELKTYLRTPHLSKFRDCGIVMDETKRIDRFEWLCEKLCGINDEHGNPLFGSRAIYVEAFFRSTFAAWENHATTGRETHYVGYSPPIVFNADKYMADFPQGKMIHIARSPFAGYADTIKRPFPMGLERYCQVWNLAQLTALTYERKYQGRFFTVRYEDLVADPKATMNALCGMVGIEPFAQTPVPSFNRVPLPGGTVFPWGTIKQATTAANEATAAELTDAQRQAITVECSLMMRAWGYLT